jgi:cellobiose-specific phosphotransferase system component IIA
VALKSDYQLEAIDTIITHSGQSAEHTLEVLANLGENNVQVVHAVANRGKKEIWEFLKLHIPLLQRQQWAYTMLKRVGG